MNLCEYYDNWLETYKVGLVREVTMKKYRNVLNFLKEKFINVDITDIDRKKYQEILNKYAENKCKQTVKDFNTILRACLQDAFHDRLIERDPTYKAIIKGKVNQKKINYLSEKDVTKLVESIDIENCDMYEATIFLLISTGARFSEILAIRKTSFTKNALVLDATYDYKSGNGIVPQMKNKSSFREVKINKKTIYLLKRLSKGKNDGEPLLFSGKIYNSTFNSRLEKMCNNVGINTIKIHGFRHTHASLLLASGVSIQTISKRLGHANTTTTQEVYLHILEELEKKDNAKINKALQIL